MVVLPRAVLPAETIIISTVFPRTDQEGCMFNLQASFQAVNTKLLYVAPKQKVLGTATNF